MFDKIGKKSTSMFGLIIGILFLSLVFGLVGEVNDVQAVAGSYSITFRAGDTDDYIPDIPYPGSGIVPNTVPPVLVGRADGNAVGMDNDADYQGDPSLQPDDMARCQIVPYFFYITVNGVTTPENGSIIMKASWGTQTTSGSEFGFNKDIMIYSAFVDYTDPANIEVAGTDATATLLSETLIDKNGLPATTSTDVEFEAQFQVDGLDNGDAVVLEVWTVLDCAPTDGNPKVTGNIHVALEEAHTNTTPPATISTGNQTNPIVGAGSFLPAPVNLNIYKFDDNLPKALSGIPLETPPWMNTIVVTAATEGNDLIDYVANQVLVADTLDPWVQIMSDQPYDIFTNPFGYTVVDDLGGVRTCSWMDDNADGLGGTLTCDLDQMAEACTVTITYWVKAVAGVPIGSVCEGAYEALPGTSVSAECLPTYLAPTGYDVMNRVDLTTVSDDITADDNWDEEPKDISYPNAVTIVSFEATAKFKTVNLLWSTESEDAALEGFNLYVAETADGEKELLNETLIRPDIYGGGASDYSFVVLGQKFGFLPFHTYFFWLEDVNQTYSSFTGPIEVTITPPSLGKFK